MKKIVLFVSMVVIALSAVSCQLDKIEAESVIKDSTVEKNDFDQWLEDNLLKPYNIDFVYRFALNESDMGYYTVPADYNSAIICAHLVKYLCVDSYDEIAGVTFTRSYFPKMFFLIGTWEYKNNGSIVLGTAEAGKKIMLAGVNFLPDLLEGDDPAEVQEDLNHYYIKTIHHEFTHILNQTKVYSDAFKQVTPTTYVADACFDTDNYWRGRGYITQYAQSEPNEDFAELLSEYVTHTAAWWEAQLAAATQELPKVQAVTPTAEDGATLIKAKIDIVRSYMQDSWNIDIDELRDIVNRRTADVAAGKVDLHTVYSL